MWRNNRRKPIRNWERELQTRRNTILYKHQSWKNNRQSTTHKSSMEPTGKKRSYGGDEKRKNDSRAGMDFSHLTS